MIRFSCKQRVFEVSGVQVGGQPGLRPIVLIGSIFYHKHRIVEDEDSGRFNIEEARRLLSYQDELSKKTGNPCMVDVVASTPKAMRSYLSFTADNTGTPILLGGATGKVRVEGLKYVKEAGIEDRVVYNSVTPHTGEEELKAIEDAGVSASILLTFGVRVFGWRDRVRVAEEWISKLKEYQVEKVLVDTGVLDVPSLGSASKAIEAVKDKLGYPAGCGAHNAVAAWRSLKKSMGREVRDVCAVSAAVLAASAGADFILYGPIEYACYVFPAIGMVDAALSQIQMEEGTRVDRSHPRYRIGKI